MKEKDVKKFASTKHKGLPEKKKELKNHSTKMENVRKGSRTWQIEKAMNEDYVKNLNGCKKSLVVWKINDTLLQYFHVEENQREMNKKKEESQIFYERRLWNLEDGLSEDKTILLMIK